MPHIKYLNPKEIPACDLTDQYYSTRELANILSVSMSTLAQYRRMGIGPKYIAFGYHTYRYARAEVLKYLEERTRASTSATRNYDLSH